MNVWINAAILFTLNVTIATLSIMLARTTRALLIIALPLLYNIVGMAICWVHVFRMIKRTGNCTKLRSKETKNE